MLINDPESAPRLRLEDDDEKRVVLNAVSVYGLRHRLSRRPYWALGARVSGSIPVGPEEERTGLPPVDLTPAESKRAIKAIGWVMEETKLFEFMMDRSQALTYELIQDQIERTLAIVNSAE